MKNILLLAHDDSGQESRLQCALDLTRALQGHLKCVDVTRQPVFMQDYATTAGGMTALIDEEQREAANASRLRARLETEDISWELAHSVGDLSDALVRHSRLADLIVLTRRQSVGEFPDMMDVASDTVLKSRAPLLVVGNHRSEGRHSHFGVRKRCHPPLRGRGRSRRSL
ncbi:universal stress protein [Sphingomonas sp. ID1715]|uniref:universal stress protein n=1 Tax=Sphingomonas sp. ID1715 TaxID=1656898 RepID=UPI001488A283|nr:universal stress protein [Sphingomonas sp. ID1715]NNM76455.1 universal stress protein [Sphingomonas sp. ID1715]